MLELFNANFNLNVKLFLRLFNCASVGGKKLIILKIFKIIMHEEKYF